MIKIAVCDDNKNDREIIKQLCKEYFNENNIKYDLKEYISGQEFLEKNDNTDVLLLDEEMEDINGLTLKNILEDKGIDTEIIFITSHTSIMPEAFGLHVCGFLVKPVDKVKLKHLLFKVIASIDSKKSYSVETKSGFVSLPLNDIIYIETVDHNCKVVLRNETYIVKKNIAEFENDLKECDFFRCHKSYIVNLYYVKEFEDDITLTNDEKIQVSRRRKTMFKDRYILFIQKKAGRTWCM